MKKCAIIPAFIEGNLQELLPDPQNYFVICADNGYAKAEAAGIRPDLIIGDFDSYSGTLPDDIPVLKLPVEKDDTDTGRSLLYAMEQGYRDITIAGGIGGRFDHTMANIQNIFGAVDKGVSVRLISEGNEITAVKNGTITIPKHPGHKLSIFALSETAEGVSLSGVYYTLNDYTLTSRYPLGVSNEFLDENAVITVRRGTLLIVISRDR